jgi:branched-chain amino acid transport system ATP-binding protein
MLAVQARVGHSFGFIRPVLSDEELIAPARAVLRECRIRVSERTLVQALAHGERRQLELAMVVAMSPRLIVLDEPMAGMSQQESHEMVALIRALKGRYSIILVEHDMDAVFALADRISVLVYGQVIATGAPAEIRTNPAVRTAYLGGG